VPTTGADPAIDQDMSDQEMLDALRSTFSALDKWRDRLANAAAPPEWSALGELDRAWPYLPPTQMALVGLCTAREHLHAIRRLIDSKELFPSATSTLARAALVGAARTVWCLEYADQVERLRRSLTLVREDYRNHKRFGDYVLDDSNAAEPEPTAADDVARLEGRLDAVERLLDFLGGAAPHKLTNHIIPIASAATEGDEQFKVGVNMLWRQQSGSAHALPAVGSWSRTPRTPTARRRRPSSTTPRGASSSRRASPIIRSKGLHHSVMRKTVPSTRDQNEDAGEAMSTTPAADQR